LIESTCAGGKVRFFIILSDLLRGSLRLRLPKGALHKGA